MKRKVLEIEKAHNKAHNKAVEVFFIEREDVVYKGHIYEIKFKCRDILGGKNMRNIKKRVIKSSCALVMAIALFLSMANLCVVFAASSSGSTVSIFKPGYGVVHLTSGGLNVREDADVNSAYITSLYNGDNIMIIGEKNNFYKIQYDNKGNYGYASKDYIQFESQNYYLQVKNIPDGVEMMGRYNSTSSVAKLSANTAFAYYGVATNRYIGVYGNVMGTVPTSKVDRFDF